MAYIKAEMNQINTFIILCSLTFFHQVVTRDTILVTDLNTTKIWKAPLETLEFEELHFKRVTYPVAVDFDPVDHKIYWIDGGYKAIIRAKLDGTEEEIVVPYLTMPEGLSIDVKNRKIYWTDTGTDRIERANLNGTDKEIITMEDHEEPRGIVVESQGGLIYWTDWGINPKIERANLDGSDRVVLVDTDLHLPNGITVDFEGKRIYWCDAGLKKIESTDLNGQNRVNLGTFNSESIGFNIHPFDIVVYNDYVYWSDWSFQQLIRMDRYIGTTANGVGPTIFRKAAGVHIFIDSGEDTIPISSTVSIPISSTVSIPISSTVYAAGAGGLLLLIILFIVLIVVCCKKIRSTSEALNDGLVSYTTKMSSVPDDEDISYYTSETRSPSIGIHLNSGPSGIAPDSKPQRYIDPDSRPAMPMPHEISPSDHLYDEIKNKTKGAVGSEGANTSENPDPPSYVNSTCFQETDKVGTMK